MLKVDHLNVYCDPLKIDSYTLMQMFNLFYPDKLIWRVALTLTLLQFVIVTSANQTKKNYPSSIELSTTISELSIGNNLLMLADPENKLNLEQVSQLELEKFTTGKFGKLSLEKEITYWIRADFNNIETTAKQQKEWLLEIINQEKGALGLIEVYIQTPKGKLHEVFSEQVENQKLESVLQGRRFNSQTFPIHFFDTPNTSIFIKIIPNVNTQISVSLWNPDYIESSNSQISSVIGVFYGVLLLIFLYNLFLNVSVGDITYFFYLLYLVAVGAFMLSLSGLGSMHLWSFLPDSSMKIALSSGAGALLWGALLTLSLLETRQHAPIINRLLLGSLPISFLLALSPFVFSTNLISWYFFSASAIIYLLTISAVLKNWQAKGNHPARLYFFSLMCLPVGLIVYSLHSYDLFPYPMLGYFSFHIAFALHLLLLSLGLIDRTHNDNKIKYIELGKQHQSIMASRRAEDEMLSRALHDNLTGLPNRLALQKRMPEIIREAEIYQQSIAVVLINLSHFHEINNTLGHQNGDELLKIVTTRLAEIANNLENSTVIDDADSHKQSLASIEGVTYAMVLLVDTQQQVEFAAKRVLTTMRKHFDFRDMSIDIGARLGVSLYPQHGKDLSTLVRRALVAMENADKNATHLTMYSPDLDPYSPRRLALMGELSQAIDQDKLVLYFQPQVCLNRNTVVGVEALARWQHKDHGFIPPDEFIPLAEKTGLTRKLTRWVIDKALEQTATMLAEGMHISMSVNLSAQNLQEPNFVTRVKSLLAKHKVPASYLILELTETAVMLDPEHAQNVLTQLSNEGIKISIDDFGTGYSSLSYIKKLPLHEVKIDKSFIQDMVNDKDDTIIVNTTLHMSHNLGLRVVAEGVESADVLELLRGLGCDIVQGYYLTRPLSPADLAIWLRSSPYSIGDNTISKSSTTYEHSPKD